MSSKIVPAGEEEVEKPKLIRNMSSHFMVYINPRVPTSSI